MQCFEYFSNLSKIARENYRDFPKSDEKLSRLRGTKTLDGRLIVALAKCLEGCCNPFNRFYHPSLMALDRHILRNIIISLLFFVLLVNKKTGKFH